MGIFSRFERKVEDGLEGAAGKIFSAPISPVQISKKAERAMKREKMVGAGKQYAPTLYTVLVNTEDDSALLGYYPTLAGETETYLSAKAAEEGLTMDGQPLVRFIADDTLKRGKFDVVAELVSAPIVAQLRREEMQRYGLLGNKAGAQGTAGTAGAGSMNAVPAATPAAAAPAAPVAATPVAAPAASAAAPVAAPAAQDQASWADQEVMAPSAAKQPLPYVPEEEIDRSIDYGEYTFNSQDFEDYEKHGPSAQLIDPAAHAQQKNAEVGNAEETEADYVSADLSGLDVETYNPATDSLNFANRTPAPAAPAPAPAVAPAPASAAPAPALNTQVFTGGMATPEPNRGAVRARLVNTATNRDFDLALTRIILGRSRACDIVVDDVNVSRSHAELRGDSPGAWILTDLGSTNGTKVNGQRITSHLLQTGDRITLGTTDLVFLEG